MLKDGATRRAHLEVAARRSAVARAELDGPSLPPECAYIWTWFRELNAKRSLHAAGGNPISFCEIESWARLTGRHPQPWQIDWLGILDDVWLTSPKDADGAASQHPA